MKDSNNNETNIDNITSSLTYMDVSDDEFLGFTFPIPKETRKEEGRKLHEEIEKGIDAMKMWEESSVRGDEQIQQEVTKEGVGIMEQLKEAKRIPPNLLSEFRMEESKGKLTTNYLDMTSDELSEVLKSIKSKPLPKFDSTDSYSGAFDPINSEVINPTVNASVGIKSSSYGALFGNAPIGKYNKTPLPPVLKIKPTRRDAEKKEETKQDFDKIEDLYEYIRLTLGKNVSKNLKILVEEKIKNNSKINTEEEIVINYIDLSTELAKDSLKLKYPNFDENKHLEEILELEKKFEKMILNQKREYVW